MANFYFTFGNDPLYPFGREEYVVVIAPDIHKAVKTFREYHANRPGSKLTNCCDWYTEEQFNKDREEYYGDRDPVEILKYKEVRNA